MAYIEQTNGQQTHIGSDVVRCRADDDLPLVDVPSLTLDPAVLLLADRTLLCSQTTSPHLTNPKHLRYFTS